MQFKDINLGLFRFNAIVYTKINDHQAVLITNGRIVEFNPEDVVEPY